MAVLKSALPASISNTLAAALKDTMNIDRLILHFDNYLPLDDTERKELSNRVIEKNIKRRQFILQENDVCKYYTFVISGLFKMYAVEKNGKENNIQFASENDWIADIGSFHNEKPSRLYIEAIEPSIILQISKDNLWYLYTNYPKFDRNFRVIIEDKFIELQNRVLQSISSTAEERYETYLEQYPNLSNRLPNTQIASYLGITPEFLSKIRNNISKK
ncbi:MAG: Crp/Fnr family transcriptional regulator [Saprospiraceae bacterium]